MSENDVLVDNISMYSSLVHSITLQWSYLDSGVAFKDLLRFGDDGLADGCFIKEINDLDDGVKRGVLFIRDTRHQQIGQK